LVYDIQIRLQARQDLCFSDSYSFGLCYQILDGEDDHVHVLVEYPPKVSVSALVNSLKGVSSRLLRKARPDLASRYWQGVLWSPSYFAASCGGAPVSIVRQYIEQQRTPD
jgi:putative transposase